MTETLIHGLIAAVPWTMFAWFVADSKRRGRLIHIGRAIAVAIAVGIALAAITIWTRGIAIEAGIEVEEDWTIYAFAIAGLSGIIATISLAFSFVRPRPPEES